LNAEANEEAVVAAITSIENKKAEMEDKMAKMEEKLAKMEDECNEFKAKVAEFKKKAEDEAKAKAEMEEKMEDEKAKNMIEGYVKQGRIKIDQINIWAQTAKAIGFEQAKNMIEALPISKNAAKIDVHSVSNDAALTNVIAGTMATIREKNKI
jgi:chromosome segregation ATPase